MASDEGLSRDESRQMRDIGRQAMSQVVGVALKQAVSHDLLRTFAVVSKVNGDGTVDLECGSEETPMPLNGVRLTLGCSTVEVGDTVVVDTYDHSPLVVSVLYSNASSGHTVASKPEVNAARSAADQALSEAKTAKAASDAAQESAESAKESADAATESAKTAQAKADAATESAATAQTKAEAAGDAATKAQSDAASAKTAATAAQSKADEAATAAATAQSKADTASTAAATAQSKAEDATASANAAGRAASNAQAAAEAAQGDIDSQRTYFWHDSDGSHVLGEQDGYRSDVRADGLHVLSAKDSSELAKFTASGAQIGKSSTTHVSIDSDSVDVRDGTDVTASFQRDGVTFLGGKYAVKTYSTALAGSSDPVTGFQVSSPGPAKVSGSTSSLVGDIGGVQSAVTAGWVQDIGCGAVMDARDKSSGAYHFVSVTSPRGVEVDGLSVSQAAHKSTYSSNLNSVDYGVNTFTPATTGRPIDSYGYCITVSSGNGGTYSYWRQQVAIVNGIGIYTRECVNPGSGASWTSWTRVTVFGHAINGVYRLYNKYNSQHLYVDSASEYNSLVSAGWTGEGLYFYALHR